MSKVRLLLLHKGALVVFLLMVIAIVLSFQCTKRIANSAMPVSRKPNIIFILADDLGYGDLGCYGQTAIKTPFLDQLAAEGMRFTDCYSGSPVCAPSRGSLLTGYHLGHAYLRTNTQDVPLRPQDTTVAEVLKGAGYATAVVGKWGVGRHNTTGQPGLKGFDHFFGFLDHAEGAYFPTSIWRNGELEEVPPGTYQQDLLTREAIEFIRRKKDVPFFLYLPYMLPHAPYEIPSLEPYEQEPWTEEEKKYAAMVTRLDRDVGLIVATLDELGLAENTAVFFTSDNGAPSPARFDSTSVFNGQKRTLYEGGIRVPMLVYWRGTVKAGQVSDTPWALWDVLATAAEMAGVDAPQGTDSISILPTLLGERQTPHASFYWEFYRKNRKGFLQAARFGKWKGLRDSTKSAMELYDLENDVGERVNLAKRNPHIVRQMKKIMRQEHQEPLVSPYDSPAHTAH